MAQNFKLKSILSEMYSFLPKEVIDDIDGAYYNLTLGSRSYSESIQRLRKAGEGITGLMVEKTINKSAVSRNGNPKTIGAQLKYITNEEFKFSMQIIQRNGNYVSHSALGKETKSYDLFEVYSIFKHFINCTVIYIVKGLHNESITERIIDIERKFNNNKYADIRVNQNDHNDNNHDKNSEINQSNEENERNENNHNDMDKEEVLGESFIRKIKINEYHIDKKENELSNFQELLNYSFITTVLNTHENSKYQKKDNFDIDGIETERMNVPDSEIQGVISTYIIGKNYRRLKNGFVNNPNKNLLIIGSNVSSGKRSTAIKLLRDKKESNVLFYINQIKEPISLYNLKRFMMDKDIEYNKSYIIRVKVNDLFDISKVSSLSHINKELIRKNSYMIIISNEKFDETKFDEYFYLWELDVKLELIMKKLLESCIKSPKRLKKYLKQIDDAQVSKLLKDFPITTNELRIYVKNIIEKKPECEDFKEHVINSYPTNLNKQAVELIEKNKNDFNMLAKLLCLSLFRKLNKGLFNSLSERLSNEFCKLINEDERQNYFSKERLILKDSDILNELNAIEKLEQVETNYSVIEESFVQFTNWEFNEKVLQVLINEYSVLYTILIKWICKIGLKINRSLFRLMLPSLTYLFKVDRKNLFNKVIIPWIFESSKGSIGNIILLLDELVQVDKENVIIDLIEKITRNNSKISEKLVLNLICMSIHKKYPYKTIMIFRYFLENKFTYEKIGFYAYVLKRMMYCKVIKDNKYIVLEAIENWCFDEMEEECFRINAKILLLIIFGSSAYRDETLTIVKFASAHELLENQVLPLYETILKDKDMCGKFMEIVFMDLDKLKDNNDEYDLIIDIFSLVFEEIQVNDDKYSTEFYKRIDYYLRKYKKKYKLERHFRAGFLERF